MTILDSTSAWDEHPIGLAGIFVHCRDMKMPVFQTGARSGTWATAPLQREPVLPYRILVVDDDPLIRRLNSEVLIYSGYQVDAANEGAAAWDALRVNNYDLLITNNEMPQVTGVDLLKKVHATRMAMPIVMATWTLPTREFDLYPWLQPAAVLMKPYSFDELLETVEKVLYAIPSVKAEIAPPQRGHGKLSNGDLRP